MKHFKSAGSVTLIVVLVALISFIYDWGSAKQKAQYDEAASVWAVAHTDWRAGPDLPIGSAIVAEVELPADVGILEEEDTWTETYSCGTSKEPKTCSRTKSEWDLVDEYRPEIQPAKNTNYNFVAPNVTYPDFAWYEDETRYTGWRKSERVTLLAHRVDGGIYLEHICSYTPADCVATLSRDASSGIGLVMWLGIGTGASCIVFLLIYLVMIIWEDYLH